MSTKMIQEKLDSYGCKTAIEEEQAIREITQEIALAALGRTDFFNNAIFHGGTCVDRQIIWIKSSDYMAARSSDYLNFSHIIWNHSQIA